MVKKLKFIFLCAEFQQNNQNRISINNFDPNKNIKLMRSKSKIEENKYSDLYLKIYSSYKNIIQKKIEERNHKIEEDDGYKDNIDDDFDRKIASRVRSRGIGFSKLK